MAAIQRNKAYVWIHCTDYDEPWYEDCGEEDYRIYSDDLPIPSEGVFLIAAEAEINGKTYHACLNIWNDADEGNPLIKYQPEIEIGEGRVSLWHGAVHQFGEEWINDDWEIIKPVIGASKEITIKSMPGILKEDLCIKAVGLGYYENENDDIAYKTF